jgi:manganese/zinc/iron transport system substrate-binding protein
MWSASNRWWRTAFVGLWLAGALAGAPGALAQVTPARADGATYRIVTTVGMVTDIVRNVAGDRAAVVGLMGEGVDPHLYKPTRTDIRRLLSADVIFYNGLLLEGKMTDSLIRAANAGKKVFAVTELLDEQYLLEPDERKGHYDPHVWMDPAAWSKAVEVVRDKLCAFDPPGAAQYRQNAERYLQQLRQLDEYAERVLKSVPERQRVLVTAHDAFNYFGRRFGFEVVGIQGISTESEAGVQDIERLVDLLVERKVGAVFVESTVSQRNINALVAGAKARGHTVVVGGELYSDAMGAPGSYEGTYLGMLDHNVTTIAHALGGKTPKGGMVGKLRHEAQ